MKEGRNEGGEEENMGTMKAVKGNVKKQRTKKGKRNLKEKRNKGFEKRKATPNEQKKYRCKMEGSQATRKTGTWRRKRWKRLISEKGMNKVRMDGHKKKRNERKNGGMKGRKMGRDGATARKEGLKKGKKECIASHWQQLLRFLSDRVCHRRVPFLLLIVILVTHD